MRLNLNPIEFLNKRADQSALKSVIEKKFKDFEYNLSYAKIDWKKSPHEMEKINEEQLISLRQAVSGLKDCVQDIEKKFDLSDDVRMVISNLVIYTDQVAETANIENMKKEFNDRMTRWVGKKENPYVIEPMASQLSSAMHNVWVQLHKLKGADFDNILSTKIKI